MLHTVNTRTFALLASCRMAILWGAVCLSLFFASPGWALDKQSFPNLEFKDDKGVTHNLTAERGKLTVVHFWATWCGPCAQEFPELDALQMRYGDQGLKVIAISTESQDSLAKVKDFYVQHAINHLAIYTDDGTAAQEVHLRGLPTTFFIGPDGKFIDAAEGPLEWNTPPIKDFIAQTLQ